MGNPIQAMLKADHDTVLNDLTSDEFNSLFNDPEYTIRLARAKTQADVAQICKEFTLTRLITGTN